VVSQLGIKLLCSKPNLNGYACVSLVQNQEAEKKGMPCSLYTVVIGFDRYLTVNRHEGQVKVHVRKYDTNEHGRKYPTRYGIVLHPKRLANLMMLEPEITKKVNERAKGNHIGAYKVHVGGGIHVSMDDEFKHVNLRLYWLPEGAKEPIPTRTGVTINLFYWDRLVMHLKAVREEFEELKNANPCHFSEDHQNQMGFFECRECSPYGDKV